MDRDVRRCTAGARRVDRFKNTAYDLVIEGGSYWAELKPKIELDNPPPPKPVRKQPYIGRWKYALKAS